MPTPLLPLALAALGLAAPPIPVPLEAEASTPYTWRVVLKFEPHPLLTPAYRDQVMRDVTTALRAATEGVARVEVLDLAGIPEPQRDPLVKAFAEKGWPALESEAFRKLTGVKTHFLRIAVARSGIRLEARQHDGSTGLPSPALRVREAATPATVGRLAGILIGRDFGPTGTVETIDADPEAVRVTFRGGTLPGFERQVKPGDVFAVVAVRELPRAVTRTPTGNVKADPNPVVRVGQPRQYTLIQADGPLVDGACKCRVLTGLEAALPHSRGVIGYRCLKLPTLAGPVQVRVLDQDGVTPAAGQLLVARANDIGFTRRPDPRDTLELRDGVFRSGRSMNNVACVIVGLGAGREWRFPVPVLGDGPVVVRVELKADDAIRAAFERECQDLRGRVAEVRTAHAALVDTLSGLILKGRNQDALDRATSGAVSLAAADAELTAELDKLKANPAAKDPLPAALLTASAEQLQTVRLAKGGIDTRIVELKESLAKQADPTRFEKEFRAKELAKSIKHHVDQGEVPQALELYDQLFELTTQEDVKAQKAKLEAEWEPRGFDHRVARDYVTDAWRKVTGLSGFQEALDPLRKATDTMAGVGDRLGLRNFLGSLEPAYARLKEVLDSLDPNAETDRAQVKALQTVSQELKKIEDAARVELKRIEAKKE